jgi:hypothetical protein
LEDSGRATITTTVVSSDENATWMHLERIKKEWSSPSWGLPPVQMIELIDIARLQIIYIYTQYGYKHILYIYIFIFIMIMI